MFIIEDTIVVFVCDNTLLFAFNRDVFFFSFLRNTNFSPYWISKHSPEDNKKYKICIGNIHYNWIGLQSSLPDWNCWSKIKYDLCVFLFFFFDIIAQSILRKKAEEVLLFSFSENYLDKCLYSIRIASLERKEIKEYDIGVYISAHKYWKNICTV